MIDLVCVTSRAGVLHLEANAMWNTIERRESIGKKYVSKFHRLIPRNYMERNQWKGNRNGGGEREVAYRGREIHRGREYCIAERDWTKIEDEEGNKWIGTIRTRTVKVGEEIEKDNNKEELVGRIFTDDETGRTNEITAINYDKKYKQ